MNRKALRYLKKWYRDNHRKPLLIRGARQVGKSTLVRLFCRENNLKLFEVNFEKRPLKCLFLGSNEIGLSRIITEIEDQARESFSPQSGLIFFDEIQESPLALKALRYFYEERPDIAIIAAGSLLDFLLTEEAISVPVGRIQYFYLGPMSFFEFLEACGETYLLARARNWTEITESQHQELMKQFLDYVFVGGMPEAVALWTNKKDPNKVREIQWSIIDTYRDDFRKYARKNQVTHLQKIFDYLPHHLGQKVIYREIDDSAKSTTIRNAIELMILAHVLLPVYHSNGTKVPLAGLKDDRVFKLYFLDVGLIGAMQDQRYQTIMSQLSSVVSGGALYEQAVAQNLFYRYGRTRPPELFYWLRDKTAGKAELDFLIQAESKIVPIEVKGGKSRSLKSLWQFVKEKSSPLALHLGPHLPNSTTQTHHFSEHLSDGAIRELAITTKIHQIPLYLAEQVEGIVTCDNK